MNQFLLVGLMVLAAWRLTRLVVEDDLPLVAWPRGRVVAFAGRRRGFGWLGELVGCPWCVTVWASAGVTFGVWLFAPLTLPVLVFGGVAGGSAIVYALVDSLTTDGGDGDGSGPGGPVASAATVEPLADRGPFPRLPGGPVHPSLGDRLGW